MRGAVRRLHHEERGAVIIFVVAFLPVAFAIAAFVVDAANLFEHRRHLQLQADAGALAAAQEFQGCFLDGDAANTAIEASSIDYAGAVHNPQIGPSDAQSRVQTRINATDYDAESYSDGMPCDTGFIDVKLTEQDTLPFFPFIGSHDVKAKARVQVFRLESSTKLLPIAAEDPVPRTAKAIFVNEVTGAEIASTPLLPNGSEGGLAIWDNSAVPVDVPIQSAHVGVRIAMSGKASFTGCGDSLVACYDADPTPVNGGLVHIRGWSTAGSPATNGGAPIARGIELYNGSCADPYFNSASSSCTIGVRGTVEFGVAPATDAQLVARIGNARYPMTYDPGTGTWSSGTVISIDPESGSVEVTLDWEQTSGNVAGQACTTRGNNPCKGDFGVVQRSFAAFEAASGPIARAEVSRAGVPWANSLELCVGCHSLVVKIGIEGSLQLSDLTSPPVHLRVTDGSQTQLLDCDPDEPLVEHEIANGCNRRYGRNEGTPCPDSPNDLWSSPEPWKCVAAEPGTARPNQISAGLNTRILEWNLPPDQRDGKADVCISPNNWPNYESGDPRVVYVVVTPFGSFAGSGNTTVPVVRLAAFYVTGWAGQGGGFDNPCQQPGNGDETAEAGDIVGRFINYIEVPNEGGGGTDPCDFSAIDVCAAVLVD